MKTMMLGLAALAASPGRPPSPTAAEQTATAAMSSEALGPGIATAADLPDRRPHLPDPKVCAAPPHEEAAVAVLMPTAQQLAPLEPLPYVGETQATDDTSIGMAMALAASAERLAAPED